MNVKQKNVSRELPLPQEKAPRQWTNQNVAILALLSFLIGVGLGSLTRSSSPPVVETASGTQATGGASTANGLRNPSSREDMNAMVEPLLATLKSEPKNTDALIQLADVYYDHKQFSEAIGYYRRALSVDAANVDARTDLGTAYWYQGSPEKAIAEYEKALRVQPDYPQTLMNLGIVRLQGLRDKQGAIRAWQRLLEKNPSFPQRDRVEQLIADAGKGL